MILDRTCIFAKFRWWIPDTTHVSLTCHWGFVSKWVSVQVAVVVELVRRNVLVVKLWNPSTLRCTISIIVVGIHHSCSWSSPKKERWKIIIFISCVLMHFLRLTDTSCTRSLLHMHSSIKHLPPQQGKLSLPRVINSHKKGELPHSSSSQSAQPSCS